METIDGSSCTSDCLGNWNNTKMSVSLFKNPSFIKKYLHKYEKSSHFRNLPSHKEVYVPVTATEI
jgi:hypothetical protein